MIERTLLPMPAGRGRLHQVASGLWVPTSRWRNNKILYEWATIAAKLLAQGLSTHRLSYMYLEYANVDDPDELVPAPSFGRDEGRSYYDGLADSADVDYLRVPITATTIESTDDDLFPGGNLLRIFAMTQGTTGTHAKPFNDSVNSKVYGAALVAAVDAGDATQDLILSRLYFDEEEDQLVKQLSGQIGCEYELTIE